MPALSRHVSQQSHLPATRSLPLLSLHASRADILAYFKNSWALTELLFSGLANEEAFYRRPYHQLRHPLIFYYGHPVSVYINKLRVAGVLEAPLNPEFEKLFEVGVDEMRWDDLHEGEQHVWPELTQVRDYRATAYALICKLIETHPLLADAHLPITQESPMWALVMGFEHERIHLETSSVLMRELPIEYVRKPVGWPDYYVPKTHPNAAQQNRMIPLPACEVTLGKPRDWPSFGWDNEYGHETRDVRPFSASAQLISNAEFLEFVKAGGYTEERYWSREGWAWRRFRNVKWPSFWVQDGPAGSHLFKLRSIFEILPMQADWPAIVNFHEAKAYCTWKTQQENSAMPYRLLTEAEHHAIRDAATQNTSLGTARDGIMSGDVSRYNLNFTTGGESPVMGYPANDKGFFDSFGNVWQWCEDHFHPLRQAQPHPYYDDFSTPCYDGEHQMILGGSFISTGDEASIFARFHFRPHFFQHAGFRLARNEDGNPACDAKHVTKGGNVVYETQGMLNQYLLMHYGRDEEIWSNVPTTTQPRPAVVHLPLACAALVQHFAPQHSRALDLGCAVGRSSFALATHFREVVGIDYSHDFIAAAQRLQRTGSLEYTRKDSGAKSVTLTAHIDHSIDRSRVRFEQGDACALPLHLSGFDAVLMANVLCRLPDPAATLERMQGVNALVAPGGVLVMTTPFSWLEQYTPRERWLEGKEAIAALLTEFDLIHEEELPFMIREHRRKFEYIVTCATVWKRRTV